jgi:hypothetical protein
MAWELANRENRPVVDKIKHGQLRAYPIVAELIPDEK